MKKLWLNIGKVSFWAVWPALFVYLYLSRRTRVLVVSGDSVVVVRGWLSSGKWSLPGGGLRFKEPSIQGAAREVEEELGIKVNPAHLRHIMTSRSQKESGLSFNQECYALELPEKAVLRPQKGEITEAKWVPWRDLYESPNVTPNVKVLLQAWFKH